MNLPAPHTYQPQHLFSAIGLPPSTTLMRRCPALEQVSELIAEFNRETNPETQIRLADELAAALKSAARLHTNLIAEILQTYQAATQAPF